MFNQAMVSSCYQSNPYGQPTAGIYQQGPSIQQTPSTQPIPPMPPSGGRIPQVPAPGQLPLEMSYIENILRLNRGKRARVYMTFEGRTQNQEKVFDGIIEAAGRDHIIISDPKTGKRYLLLMVYLDYVEFDEEIAYDYPFSGTSSSPFYGM